MGLTGPSDLVSLVALSDGPPGREGPATWREDWDRRQADLTRFVVAERRFRRVLTLRACSRRCERVGGVLGDARRWQLREAYERTVRLGTR